jgi:hypothetical protein
VHLGRGAGDNAQCRRLEGPEQFRPAPLSKSEFSTLLRIFAELAPAIGGIGQRLFDAGGASHLPRIIADDVGADIVKLEIREQRSGMAADALPLIVGNEGAEAFDLIKAELIFRRGLMASQDGGDIAVELRRARPEPAFIGGDSFAEIGERPVDPGYIIYRRQFAEEVFIPPPEIRISTDDLHHMFAVRAVFLGRFKRRPRLGPKTVLAPVSKLPGTERRANYRGRIALGLADADRPLTPIGKHQLGLVAAGTSDLAVGAQSRVKNSRWLRSAAASL